MKLDDQSDQFLRKRNLMMISWNYEIENSLTNKIHAEL